MANDDFPFKVVRTNRSDEVLARSINLYHRPRGIRDGKAVVSKRPAVSARDSGAGSKRVR
jgi:hypothetical protein